MERKLPEYPFGGCDGHHEMVELRLAHRGAVEPDASLARRTGGCENTFDRNQERALLRKTMFAVVAVAAIGAAALIPTEARAGGGKGGGGMGGGYHGHGHGHWWGSGVGGIVVIGPSCWRRVSGLGRVYVCY
jgi:hypothetical protein